MTEQNVAGTSAEQRWRRLTAWAAALVAVVAVLLIVDHLRWLIDPILAILPPFAIAFLLAYMLDPAVERLQHRGLQRRRAVILIGIAFLLVFAALVVFLIPLIIEQARSLAANYPEYYRQVSGQADSLLRRESALLQRFNLPTSTSELFARYSGQMRTASAAAFTAVSAFAVDMFGKLLWLIIIPIVTLSLLSNFDLLKRKIIYLLPQAHRQRFVEVGGAVGEVFGGYIRGLVIISALYAAAVILVLLLLGVNYAVIIGVVSGALYVVPFIGAITVVVVSGLVAYVQDPASMHVAWWVVPIVMFIVNNAFDYGVYPRVVGGSVGLSVILSLFAVLLGASLFGIVGMILAVPVAASVQIVIYNLFPRLKEPEQGKKQSEPARSTKKPPKQGRKKK